MNNAIHINKVEKSNFLKISRTHYSYGFLWIGIIIIIQIGLWYSNLWHPIFLSSFLLFGFVWIKYTKEHNDQISVENKKILNQLITSNFNKISYHPKKYILRKCFLESALYDFSPFIFKGSNLLVGEGWFISNIQVSLPISKNNDHLTIFDGIFAKIETQHIINGNVIIKPLPVKDKTVIPEILQHLIHRYYSPKVKSITTGDITFDEKFEIFASSNTIQSSVVTKNAIKSILKIDETILYYFGKEYTGMELSYINNKLYIGVKGIKLFRSDESCEAYEAQKYMEIIKQITNINKQ